MSKYVSLDNLTRYDGKIKDYIGTATASFITKSVNDLTNYYLKSETYTKSEVNNLISAISTIDIQVVQTLPTQDISTSTIYLVPKSTAQTNNAYDEYVYVSDGASTPTYSWEKIGDTEIDLSNYVTNTELATELANYTDTTALTSLLAGKQDEIDSSHKLSADLVDDSNTTNKFFSGNYNDLSNKPTIPTNVSDLTNDTGYITGMTILAYGKSTWADFIAAYSANKVVYCRASSNSNPATGSQTRLAFMAYVSNETTPTSVEFQYYRSVSSHSATQQGDQVFVYKLESTNGGKWTVTTREAMANIDASGGLTRSYSGNKLTIDGSSKQDIFQYSTMPTAGSTYANEVVQYIGTTNSTYTNGYFYKCTNSSGSYKWEQLEVQPDKVKYMCDSLDNTSSGSEAFSVIEQMCNDAVNNPNIISDLLLVKYGTFAGFYYVFYEDGYSLIGATNHSSFSNGASKSQSTNARYVFPLSYNASTSTLISVGSAAEYPAIYSNSYFLATDTNYSTPYTPQYDGSPATKKYVDDSITASAIQYSTMPTASSTTVGNIVQYTGTTDSTYTNGYFYIGTTDGESTPTYSWEQIDVQPSSSGGGSWGSITGTLSNQTDLNDELLMRPVINPTVIIGSSTSSTPLIIDELDPGAYFIKNTAGNGTNYVRLDSSLQSNVNLQCVGSGYDSAYNSGVYLYIPKAIDYSNLTDGDILFYVNTDRNTYDNGYMVDAILTYVYDSTVASKMKIDATKTISKGIGLPLTQGTQGFYGKKTFYSGIASDIGPVGDKDLTTKKYVDTSHPVDYLSKDVYPNPWSYNDLWDLEYNSSYPYTFAYGGEGWNDYWTNTNSTTTTTGNAYIKMKFPEELVGKEVTVNYDFTLPSGASGYASIYYNTTNKVSKSSSATGSFTISSVVSGDYIVLQCNKYSSATGTTFNVYFTFPDLITASQIYAIKCSKVAKEIYDDVMSNYNADLGTTSKTYILELRGPDMYTGEPDYNTDVVDKNLLFRYISKSGTITSIKFENIQSLTSYEDISIVNITYNSSTDTYSLEGPYYADEGAFKQFLKTYDDDYHTKAKALILEDIPRKDFTIGKSDVNTEDIYVKAHSSDANTKALKLTGVIGNIINWKNTIEDIDVLGTEMAVLTYSVGTVYDSTNNKICTQRNTLYYDPVNDALRLDEVKTALDLVTGGGSWGSITGTLSNQTDLASELLNRPVFTPTRLSNSTTGTSSNPYILDEMTPGYYWIDTPSSTYVYFKLTSSLSSKFIVTSNATGSGCGYYIFIPKSIDYSTLTEGDIIFYYDRMYVASTGSMSGGVICVTYSTSQSSKLALNTDKSYNRSYGSVVTGSAQTWSGVKTFSSVPVCSTQPTSSSQLANKAYVDSIVGDIQTALETLVDGSNS